MVRQNFNYDLPRETSLLCNTKIRYNRLRSVLRMAPIWCVKPALDDDRHRDRRARRRDAAHRWLWSRPPGPQTAASKMASLTRSGRCMGKKWVPSTVSIFTLGARRTIGEASVRAQVE